MKEPPATLKVGTGLSWFRQMHDPPYTQQDVADLLGLSKATYHLIENGRLLPTEKTVTELVRILGVPPGALFVPEVLALVIQYGLSGDPSKLVE